MIELVTYGAVTELACDDCGDVCATSRDGIWTDGDAVACDCGTEWMVSVDTEEPDVYLVRVET